MPALLQAGAPKQALDRQSGLPATGLALRGTQPRDDVVQFALGTQQVEVVWYPMTDPDPGPAGFGKPSSDVGILIGAQNAQFNLTVPEPQIWALMLAGIVAVAGLARRRNSTSWLWRSGP